MEPDFSKFGGITKIIKSANPLKDGLEWINSLPKGVLTRYKIGQFNKLGLKNEILIWNRK